MYKKGKEQYNEPPLSITQLNNYTHFLSPVFSLFSRVSVYFVLLGCFKAYPSHYTI